MGIFGKSGGEMLALFSDAGAFDDAAAQVGSQAEILQRNAEIFDKISNQLGLVGTKVQGFFVGVADKVAPVLAPLMDFFAGTDFASIGQRLGDALALGLQALVDGSMWTILLDSAKVAIGSAINFLWAGLQSAIVGAGVILFEKFKIAMELISILGTLDFWKGAANQLAAIAIKFNAMIHGAFAKILELMRPLLSRIGLGGMADTASGYLNDKSQAMSNTGAEYQQAANTAFAPAMDRLTSRMAEASNNVGSAMAAAFNDSINIVDIGGARASLDRSITTLADKVFAMQNAFAGGMKQGGKVGMLNLDGPARNGADKARNGADKGNAPSASRLMTLAGFGGIFVKDSLLAESRRQTAELEQQTVLLNKIANQKPAQNSFFDPMLRFA
jgi:Skp family chaperone for outer membrane proteins